MAVKFLPVNTQSGLLLSHPTGNANVRAALLGLLRAGILAEFHTTIAAYPGNMWDLLGKTAWGEDFQRRRFDERLRHMTIQHPFRELGRLVSGRFKLMKPARHESSAFSVDAVYRAQDRIAAKRLRQMPESYTGAYTYEDGALETFKAAKELGLRCIYDLPIVYWQTRQKLLQEEAERLPAWKATLGGLEDSEDKLNRKTKELELSDLVMCPSQFVARSIPVSLQTNRKIVVCPFGSPSLGAATRPNHRTIGKKLRVLFAGSMSQRKGLGDLFAAMQMLNRADVELVVLGAPQAPFEFYRQAFGGFVFEPGRAHGQVLELMRNCDVFCLPSIAEGRALVMQEAMSQGLPLIITPNTGGEDLVIDGVTGFLVPIRRPDQIASRIAWFADNRSALPDMARAAQAKANQLTWENYGQTIADSILQLARN